MIAELEPWKTQVSTELSDILLRLNRLAVEAVDRRLPDLNELISAAWTRTYDAREAVDPS